jgi:hypothetical protein
MRYRALRRFFLIVAFGLVTTVTIADERTWLKQDYSVSVDEEEIARYTTIATVDQLQPRLLRILYRDDQQRLLVLRLVVDVPSHATQAEIIFPSTGESIILETPDDQTVVFRVSGGSSMTFSDENRATPAVRTQAGSIFSGASVGFKDALRNLTRVGTAHGGDLLGEALTLADVLYPEFAEVVPVFDTVRTGQVRDFDPQTTPPGAFEVLFGSHYFE